MSNVTLVGGHVPNYVNPPSQQPLVLGVQIGMTAFALVCVALRLYTRKCLRNVFGIEDWFIMTAMALAMVASICTCLGVVLGGTGLHIWDIKPGVNRRLNAQFSYANQFVYQWILQLTKISILLFYVTLAHTRFVQRLAYGLMAACFLDAIACTFVEVFQCTPVAKSVFGSLVAGKCIVQSQFFIASGWVNLALDIAVLVLPVPLLWRLQAPMKQRIALIGLFCVGIFACTASVIRLHIWYKAAGDGNRNSADATWNRVAVVNWSCIEYCSALICASLPHLKPLIVKTIPNFFTNSVFIKSLTYPRPEASRSRRSALPIANGDVADAFSGGKRGSTRNVVTGGTKSDSRSFGDSTEEIWTGSEERPSADKKDWHIMKRIEVNVDRERDDSPV